MVTGLPGLRGLPVLKHVVKVYRGACVIAQIQRQQMVEILAAGLPLKPRAAV